LEIVGCGEDSEELIEDQHDISVNSTPNDIMATIVTAMQHAKSVAEVRRINTITPALQLNFETRKSTHVVELKLQHS